MVVMVGEQVKLAYGHEPVISIQLEDGILGGLGGDEKIKLISKCQETTWLANRYACRTGLSAWEIVLVELPNGKVYPQWAGTILPTKLEEATIRP
jgi:hypothetical protein